MKLFSKLRKIQDFSPGRRIAIGDSSSFEIFFFISNCGRSIFEAGASSEIEITEVFSSVGWRLPTQAGIGQETASGDV